ncbi:MAG: Nudix family hydrolase [Gammaproteobacteria bacterium]|nr:Nudix family hydrolase [Gammaproteobacteria bacterium]MBU1978737.1 Nudix family hydrolase [Gammaproteobacteria bacterium]
MTNILEVAAAVMQRSDGEFLLAERPAGKLYAGWWEFPGGKIEAGESPYHALVRELHEELGIDVDVAHPWLTRVYTYPHATVRLHFFRVVNWHGEPHGKENQRLSWQYPDAVSVTPLLPANGPVLRSLNLPSVCAITHAVELGEELFIERLQVALQQGLKLIQVREKAMDAATLRAFAAEVVWQAHAHGARVVINGDAALAREVGADGVQLNSAQLMALTARPELELVSASCHDRHELERVVELELDFALLSPVLPTQSHPGASVLGWEGFAHLVRDLPMPVYALGGVSRADMDEARRHGAHGIAMLRGAWQALERT